MTKGIISAMDNWYSSEFSNIIAAIGETAYAFVFFLA
jgi:hypothetical protein